MQPKIMSRPIFSTLFLRKKYIYIGFKWSTCSVKVVTTQPNVYIGFYMYNRICVHVCDVNLKGYLLIIKQASSVCVKTEVNLGFISRDIACEPDSYWPFHMNGLYIYIYIYIYIYSSLLNIHLAFDRCICHILYIPGRLYILYFIFVCHCKMKCQWV